MKKILLNSAKNNTNVNVGGGEYISLSTKQRSIPLEKHEATINHYELYLKERNECKKYKMYFTIHPYMTNVLSNAFTEIVYNEGGIMSDIITPEGKINLGHDMLFEKNIYNERTKDALFNYDGFVNGSSDKLIDRRYQMIRDTEYSHPELGCLTYHCGLDIFNNHYLRSDGFFRVRKANNNGNKDVFNTIEDFLIYSDGNIAKHIREIPGNTVIEKSNNENGLIKKFIDWAIALLDNDTVTNTVEKNTHLFTHENILSVYDAFMNGVKEDNGWIGFYNKSYLPEINFSKNISISKCLNDKDSCAFVDLYPDRTLFSFLPKINDKFGSREEYNWGWCLTYPYDSTFKDESGEPFDFFNEDGLKVIWGSTSSLYLKKDNNHYDDILFDEKYNNIIRDKRMVYFRTKCKHNFAPNDIIRIKCEDHDFSLRVVTIGDEKRNYENYYFSVSYDDLADEFGENKQQIKDENNPNGIDVFYIKVPKELFVAKIIDGIPCKYYVRKFKKIGDIHSTMNRMAFSNTIFNDRISQIIYDEDINVSGLKDNLGREVSEIFITFVKNNKGWEKYYLSGVTSPVSVEYSHCFGRITSGFNFECGQDETVKVHPTNNITESEYFQKHNIRSLYNLENFGDDINLNVFCDVMGIDFIPPSCVENNINIDNTEFYGDFVEFSPSNITENVIEDVYHRFNTAQRETNLKNEYFNFSRFKYDEIEYDDYDFNILPNVNGSMPTAVDESGIPNFSVKINHHGFRRELMSDNETTSEVKNMVRDNIFPEGYFYKPHYQVKLKEYSDIVSLGFDAVLVREAQIDIKQDNKFKRFSFPIDGNYGLVEGDIIVLFYEDGHKKEYYVYPSFEKNRVAFYDYEKTLSEITDGLKIIFYKNRNIPEHAYYTGDGSGKYLWRELIKDTDLTQDSDIYNRMYANGSVYINTNINFYLRRQDPYGIYGLQYTTSKSENAAKFIINGVEVDKGDVDYKIEEKYSVCEI